MGGTGVVGAETVDEQHLLHCPERASQLANLLKALGHPLRVRILAELSKGPRHVNALAERLGAKQAIVSQQLVILRARNVVRATRRDGFKFYELVQERMPNLLELLHECLYAA